MYTASDMHQQMTSIVIINCCDDDRCADASVSMHAYLLVLLVAEGRCVISPSWLADAGLTLLSAMLDCRD